MHANQTDVQKILGGVQQYLIPLFQRPYTWEARQWGTLWSDLDELRQDEKPRHHFIGSVVTMPATSVPEGVSKFVLIDGQQRLTTLLILLAAVRDKARVGGDARLAEKIDDLMLKNRHQDGNDVYKVLPTQTRGDRPAFCAIMDGSAPAGEGRIGAAYAYFGKKLRTQTAPGLETLYTLICKNLILVSIVLDKDDNPHLIFESLNGKGEPLAQADLIRNFFFMRIHADTQDKVFRDCWQPMEKSLGDQLTEYIRHYLMRDGRVVKKGDVYLTVKELVEQRDDGGVRAYLDELAAYSGYYAKLTDPAGEGSRALAGRLARLNRFEATTAYPFLLNVYHDYARGRVTEGDFAAVLDVLETFLIRRFVCGVPTNALGKIFIALYAQAAGGPLLDGVKRVLADKNFPRDKQFRDQFVTLQLYGGGDRRDKAKLILDRLEDSFEHKESVDTAALEIEHVMPQTLTEGWKGQLGDDWAAAHEYWLHTVGNLTLTGYNPELSNAEFPKKQVILAKSHVEMSRYFSDVEAWNGDAVGRRGEALAERASAIWPDFARGDAGGDVEAEPEDEREEFAAVLEAVLDDLGGSVSQVGSGRFRVHRLADGRVVNLKYSRSHGKYYWFGVHASLWEDLKRAGATHVVLVLGASGYAAVPMGVMTDYVAEAGTSPKADGTTRHYHVLVSTGPKPRLFHHGKPTRVAIEKYLTLFGSAE